MWPEHGEGYHPWGVTDAEWDRRTGTSRGHADNYALYNAPAGTEQRMAVYYYLNANDDRATRESVLAYTHNDVFKPVPGYKVMTGHFHMDFNELLRDRKTWITSHPGSRSSAHWESTSFTWATSMTTPIPAIRATPLRGAESLFRGFRACLRQRFPGHSRRRARCLLRRPLVPDDAEAGLLLPYFGSGRGQSWARRKGTSVRPARPSKRIFRSMATYTTSAPRKTS